MTPTDEALVAEARDWLEKMKDRGYHPLVRQSHANAIIDRLASRLSALLAQGGGGGWVKAKELFDVSNDYGQLRATRVAAFTELGQLITRREVMPPEIAGTPSAEKRDRPLHAKEAGGVTPPSPSPPGGWDDAAVERAEKAAKQWLGDHGYEPTKQSSDLKEVLRAALNAAAPRESQGVEPPPNPSEREA